MPKGHKPAQPPNKMPALPADNREAVQWFVNVVGLYLSSSRGLLVTEFGDDQKNILDSAVIDLKSRGINPLVLDSETVVAQADHLWQQAVHHTRFGRPLASQFELEVSGTDVLVLKDLDTPESARHLWYLFHHVFFPRALAQKPTLITSQLTLEELADCADECEDVEFSGRKGAWRKIMWLLESTCVHSQVIRSLKEQGLPPMLNAERVLLEAVRERGLTVQPQYVLGDYMLDLAVLEKDKKIDIECDVLTTLDATGSGAWEAKKNLLLLSDGWKVLKFGTNEIASNVDACVDVVEEVWTQGRKRSTFGRLLSGQAATAIPELPGDDDLQRLAITHGAGPCAVEGGAGTGKTSCVVHRVAFLLSQGINPDRICVISHSQETARTLKSAVELIADRQSVQRVSFHSWHDLGLKILKENLGAIKRKPPLKIEANPQKVIQRLLVKYRKDLDPTTLELSEELDEFTLASLISLYKANLIAPKHLKERSKSDVDELVSKVYQGYEDQLQKINRVDRDDMVSLAAQVLVDQPEVARKYQQQYDFVLVDEYQDATAAGDLLARVIAAPQDNLYFSGDEDESIYESKGGLPRLMADISIRLPNARCYILEKNWRSHPAIVDHSRQLIANLARRRIAKDMISGWGPSQTGAIVGPQVAETEEREAQWVAEEIAQLIEAGRDPKDIAVLYRYHRYGIIIEEALSQRGISCVTSHPEAGLVPDEVGDVMAFMRLVMDPDGPKARESFERVCQLRVKEIDPKLFATIAGFAEVNNLSYLKAVEIYSEAVPDPACQDLRKLVNILRDLNQRNLAPADTIAKLRRTQGLNDYYKSIKVPPGVNYEPLQKLAALEEDAKKFTTVTEFVKAQTAIPKQSSSGKEPVEHVVHILTLHEAKGKEFAVVFLVGLAEGLFPADSVRDREEERRLCYVGMTRAKDLLYLSYPSIFNKVGLQPSSFLVEARLMAALPPQMVMPQVVQPALPPSPVAMAPAAQQALAEPTANAVQAQVAMPAANAASLPAPVLPPNPVPTQSLAMEMDGPDISYRPDLVGKELLPPQAPTIEAQAPGALDRRLPAGTEDAAGAPTVAPISQAVEPAFHLNPAASEADVGRMPAVQSSQAPPHQGGQRNHLHPHALSASEAVPTRSHSDEMLALQRSLVNGTPLQGELDSTVPAVAETVEPAFHPDQHGSQTPHPHHALSTSEAVPIRSHTEEMSALQKSLAQEMPLQDELDRPKSVPHAPGSAQTGDVAWAGADAKNEVSNETLAESPDTEVLGIHTPQMPHGLPAQVSRKADGIPHSASFPGSSGPGSSGPGSSGPGSSGRAAELPKHTSQPAEAEFQQADLSIGAPVEKPPEPTVTKPPFPSKGSRRLPRGQRQESQSPAGSAEPATQPASAAAPAMGDAPAPSEPATQPALAQRPAAADAPAPSDPATQPLTAFAQPVEDIQRQAENESQPASLPPATPTHDPASGISMPTAAPDFFQAHSSASAPDMMRAESVDPTLSMQSQYVQQLKQSLRSRDLFAPESVEQPGVSNAAESGLLEQPAMSTAAEPVAAESAEQPAEPQAGGTEPLGPVQAALQRRNAKKQQAPQPPVDAEKQLEAESAAALENFGQAVVARADLSILHDKAIPEFKGPKEGLPPSSRKQKAKMQEAAAVPDFFDNVPPGVTVHQAGPVEPAAANTTPVAPPSPPVVPQFRPPAKLSGGAADILASWDEPDELEQTNAPGQKPPFVAEADPSLSPGATTGSELPAATSPVPNVPRDAIAAELEINAGAKPPVLPAEEVGAGVFNYATADHDIEPTAKPKLEKLNSIEDDVADLLKDIPVPENPPAPRSVAGADESDVDDLLAGLDVTSPPKSKRYRIPADQSYTPPSKSRSVPPFTPTQAPVQQTNAYAQDEPFLAPTASAPPPPPPAPSLPQPRAAFFEEQEAPDTEPLAERPKAQRPAWAAPADAQIDPSQIYSPATPLPSALVHRVHCSECAAELEQGSRFCGECGTFQQSRIPACHLCGSPLEPSAKFCGECGSPRVDQQPPVPVSTGGGAPPPMDSPEYKAYLASQEKPTQKNWMVKLLKFLEQ